MKVHDVLHKGKVTLRILVIKDDHCFCINCNAGSMPAWMPANSLEDYTPDHLKDRENIKILDPTSGSGSLLITIGKTFEKYSASKGYIKAAKKNKLQAKNIKQIADTYIGRLESAKYSRRVSKEEIVDNDYNLNIPRYVDSSDPDENWDFYSLMRGGIPNYEIDEMKELWDAFPSLKTDLFTPINVAYSKATAQESKAVFYSNSDVKAFLEGYIKKFGDFGEYLKNELIADPLEVPVLREEDRITEEIFKRYQGIPLVDHYEAYQILDDLYAQISTDLELMHAEGFEAVRVVDPNMVTKKEDDKTIEVQKGWNILSFAPVSA